MNPAFFSVVLLLLILVLTWQTIFTANKDLSRAGAWGEMGRRALPFIALLLMAGSLPFVRSLGGDTTLVWLVVFALLIVAASLLAVPRKERQANRAFRAGKFDEAVSRFQELAASSPLPRNHAFLGAALGASGRFQESVDASSVAIDRDPEYGLAYYNRGLILLKMNKTNQAKKDLRRSLEVDMPRRFKKSVQKRLDELDGK